MMLYYPHIQKVPLSDPDVGIVTYKKTFKLLNHFFVVKAIGRNLSCLKFGILLRTIPPGVGEGGEFRAIWSPFQDIPSIICAIFYTHLFNPSERV